MSNKETDKRQGNDRRSDKGRRTDVDDRRVEQDPAWVGEGDRRKGTACRRESDDRRKGKERREQE